MNVKLVSSSFSVGVYNSRERERERERKNKRERKGGRFGACYSTCPQNLNSKTKGRYTYVKHKS